MKKEQHEIQHSVHIDASAEAVWDHVTNVDISSFRHPAYLVALGIPEPLRAEVAQAGIGGRRTAYFSNKRRFSQEITAWRPRERYAFTFQADPGFRVAYILDLFDGPFRMEAGAYQVEPDRGGVRLTLFSQYALYGLVGACLRIPVRIVMALFQNYLLSGIKANAEQGERQELT